MNYRLIVDGETVAEGDAFAIVGAIQEGNLESPAAWVAGENLRVGDYVAFSLETGKIVRFGPGTQPRVIAIAAEDIVAGEDVRLDYSLLKRRAVSA